MIIKEITVEDVERIKNGSVLVMRSDFTPEPRSFVFHKEKFCLVMPGGELLTPKIDILTYLNNLIKNGYSMWWL